MPVLVAPKDPIKSLDICRTVYRIACAECNVLTCFTYRQRQSGRPLERERESMLYIGQSCRPLERESQCYTEEKVFAP